MSIALLNSKKFGMFAFNGVRKHFTKRQLEFLLGSLLYISKCVHCSRYFLNGLLDVSRSMEDRSQVPVTMEAKRDINWFLKFIPLYNGVTFFYQKPTNFSIELDASLQGMGARWAYEVYALDISLGYLDTNSPFRDAQYIGCP